MRIRCFHSGVLSMGWAVRTSYAVIRYGCLGPNDRSSNPTSTSTSLVRSTSLVPTVKNMRDHCRRFDASERRKLEAYPDIEFVRSILGIGTDNRDVGLLGLIAENSIRLEVNPSPPSSVGCFGGRSVFSKRLHKRFVRDVIPTDFVKTLPAD